MWARQGVPVLHSVDWGASGEDMGTRDVRVHGGRGWEVMPMGVLGVRGLVLGAGVTAVTGE